MVGIENQKRIGDMIKQQYSIYSLLYTFLQRVLFFLIYLGAIDSYGASVNGSVTPSVGDLGDSFTYELSVSGQIEKNIEFPRVDGVEVTGTGTSTQMTVINGRMNRILTLQFYLQIENSGQFTIPPLTVHVDGKSLQTEPVSFEVKKPSDHFSGDGDTKLPAVFVERKLSKSDPFVGESILSTTKLYYRVSLSEEQRQIPKVPNLKIAELKKEASQEQFGGITYNVLTYYDVIVALAPGIVTIPSDQVAVQMIVKKKGTRSGGLLDDFFNQGFGRRVEKKLASEENRLEAKPLPVGINTSIVGDFKLNAEVSERSLKQGETSTITVKIEGKGMLDNLTKVPIQLPEGLKVYPDKPEYIERPTKKYGMTSRKTFKLAIVPTKVGEFDLGEVTIEAYNPDEEKVELLQAQLGIITVEKGEEDEVVVATQTNNVLPLNPSEKNKVKQIAMDLIDIHRDVSISKSHGMDSGDIIFLGLFGSVPLVIVGFSFVGGFLARNGRGQEAKRKKSKAHKDYQNAKEQLMNNSTEQGSRDQKELFLNFVHLFKEYFGCKMEVHGASLTAKEISGYLESHGLSGEMIQKVEEVFGQMDRVLYQDLALTTEDCQSFAASLDTIVEEVEKHVK